MRRLGALVVSIGCLVGLAAGLMASPASASRDRPQAVANFTVTVGGQTVKFEYGQSPITESTLTGTAAVPVVLHATASQDFLQEFVLAGRVKKGTKKTSAALALGIHVNVRTSSLALDSTVHECTVRVGQRSRSRITGSFSCTATVSAMRFVASGAFMAQ
jgi:hypothetical protein